MTENENYKKAWNHLMVGIHNINVGNQIWSYEKKMKVMPDVEYIKKLARVASAKYGIEKSTLIL